MSELVEQIIEELKSEDEETLTFILKFIIEYKKRKAQ